jgi:hypothetical protein
MGGGMNISDWCVAGRELADTSITIDGSPTALTFPSGGAYLVHPTATLSMLARLVVSLAAAGVVNPAAFVTEARFVRLTSDGVFSIVWGAATVFRDLLGFDSDLVGASSYTAPNRSTLLWSPGKRFTPELAPLNSHGQQVLDVSSTIGAQGRQTVRREGDPTTIQRFSARHVRKERYFDSPPNYAVGELVWFWLEEMATSAHFIVLREVIEGASVTASADYSSSLALGPYVADMSDDSMHRTPFGRSTGFELVECYYDVAFPVVRTAEFSA